MLASPSVADAAVSRSQAEQRVLRALDIEAGKKPVVLFRNLTTLKAGTAIRQAGPSTATAKASRPSSKLLKAAGVDVVKAAPIFTVNGEPAWFFYADLAPFQAYEHAGRVAIIGKRTGRVRVSKTLAWPPLIGTKLPAFLQNFAAYRNDKYRVFERSWTLNAGATNAAPAATRQARGNEKVVPPLPSTLSNEPAALAARREAARQLALEKSCAIRVSDSLGDFFDAGPVDSTRAALGRILFELSQNDAGFYTAWYRTADGTPADLVARAIKDKGCRDVLLYLAGGGTTLGKDPAVGVGLRARPGGKLERQLVTASAVRKILAAHPDVTFKLAVEAPKSGSFIAAVSGAPNLLLAASSSRGNDGSFTALGEVVNEAGAPVSNAYNPNGYLEFTNRLITGLGCFLSRGDEVDAAVRAKAEGRTKSFFAWMLARAVGICGEGYLADQVEGAPAPPQLQLTFSQPTDADLNQTPVATDLALATDEDTPLAITLPATDADKNSLSFTIVDAPSHGTLSGGPGAARTYTPAADFTGDDQFTFTASDGKATSAKRTVKITVKPVNDAPKLTLGASATTFTEAGPAVAVDPGLVVADVDDTTLTGATVAIGAGFESGADVLGFTAAGGITGAYDVATGVLTLTGTAPIATYQSVLRSVTFSNATSALSSTTRQIVFRASDGKVFGASPDRAVAVSVVNDAPVLAGGGTAATFVEDAASGELVAPNVTVADVDSPNLASATARISAGHQASEDQLTFTAQPGITGVFDAATGVLSFTGSASKATYQAVLRSVRYRNGNTANPATATRTVTLQVDDGAATSSASNTVTGTVDVTRVNDAPTVTGSGSAPTFTEGGSGAVIDGALLVGDVDSATVASATVAITSGFDASEDVLAASAALPGGLTGAYNAATGVYAITGSASPAVYQAALRLIVYRNTDGDDPSGTSRTVRFIVDDGESVNPASDPLNVSVLVAPINDAPVLAGGGNTVTFVEDGADVLVNSALTVSDVDSPTLAGATVQITTAYQSGEDRLLFATQNGITGSFDTATGTLTLSGSATVAQYQAALRSIQYRNINTSNPSATQRVVTFRVNDGAASSNVSNSVVSNADVTPTNDAPTAVSGGASPTFTEGGSAIVIDSALAVGDVDSANLASATVSISTGFDAADDILAFSNTATITGSYNAATGVLTLTGADTVANYQAALRSVTYRNADTDNPSTAARTIQFRVSDGALVSAAASTTVSVAAVNDLPVLVASPGDAAWVENATPAAIAIDPSLALGDVDDANLTGATVAITGGFVPSQDVLAFGTLGTISATYNAATGVLTLTGTATVAQYQAALRTVTYDNTSDTPTTTSRTITFTVADSSATSVTATRGVQLTADNDAPRLIAGGGSPTWTEGGADVVVDNGIQVSDPEADQITGGTVAIAGNWTPSDELVFSNQNGITGTYNAGSGVLTLTGTASAANYQTALRSVQFRNNSGSPSTLVRGIDFAVTDGADVSNTVSTSVSIVSNNTAPVLASGGNTVAFTEDSSGVVVNSAITATDGDDTDLESATIQIGATGYDAADDELTFANTASITGSWSSVTRTLTLTGTDTVANYQAALRTVQYVNNDQSAPSTDARTVTFRVNDGEADSNPVSSTVTITPVNDAPTLTAGTGNVRTFTEGGAAVAVDDAITVADADNANLAAASVSITTGFSSAQGDALSFTNQNGIVGSYDSATGVLTLTGSATVAQYRDALRSITFSNTSDAPTASRTVTFTVNDGAATSAGVTHAVTLQGVNDAPTLSGGGTLNYTENDAATAISPALALGDVDSANIGGATVEITAGHVNGEDVLSFVNTASITGSFNAATGRLTLSGTDTVANYQAALRAVRYANTSEDPSTASRTVTYTASDAAPTPLSASTTATINVAAVNDAPVAADVTHSGASAAIGNTALVVDDPTDGAIDPNGPQKSITGDLLAGATDPDSSGLSITPGTIATNDGGSLTIEADGDYVFRPAAGASCTDTSDFADYTLTDNESVAATDTGRITFSISDCVWYVDNTAAAGGNGTSGTPYDTLDEADGQNQTGAYLYVYRGDGTATGLTDDVTLATTQRLVGGAEPLTVNGTSLEAANAANRPAIAGTIDVAAGNVVEGVRITSSASPAIRGNGAADASGTIDNVVLAGAGGGVELTSTTGTWDVSDLTATSSGGSAFAATGAGTVNFTSTGTISLSNTSGPGLAITSSATSGVIDSTTVSSGASGVALTGNTGSLTLDDVNLATSGTALLVSSSNNVTVNNTGDATATSSGGTAVDLNTDGATPANHTDVSLTTVSSSGGARGIDIDDIGDGTFAASGGTLQGQTAAAVSVAGGSGAISYGGTIGNGSGLSASVTGRTGGAVTLSGNINDTNDASGGITLSGSSGGSTVLSGGTKTLNTGTTDAIAYSATGAHLLSITGGGLDIDTTSGGGINGTGASGTIEVTGTGNSITSTTGTALSINGPDIGAADATFQSIASNSATSGIVLANTGSAGGLHVTGSGGAGTGGTIQNSSGPGVNLTNTTDVQLASVNVTGGQDDGIRGAGVTGFQLTGSSAVTNNGNAVTESGIDMTELSGTPANPVTLTSATVTGNADDNLAIVNDAASISSLSITNGSYSNNSATTGNDGIRLQNTGAGSITGATISGATFTNNRGDHIQVLTDNSTTATQNVTIQNNDLNGTGNQPGNTMLGGGIALAAGGDANQTIVVTGNDIERPKGSAISLNTSTGTAPTVRWTVTGNDIGTPGDVKSGSDANVGIYGNVNGNGNVRALVNNNTIVQTAFSMIDIVQNDGDANLDLTMKGNDLDQAGDALTFIFGVRVVFGSDVGDEGDNCLDMGDPSVPGNKNQLFNTETDADPDIRVRQNGATNATLKLPGYGGGDLSTYLVGRNDRGGTPIVQFTSSFGTVSAGTCLVP